MCLSEKTAGKAFKQLSDVKLIYEKRRGLGKPNWIFVGKIEHEPIDIKDKNNLQVLNSKIWGSGKVKNTVLDRENLWRKYNRIPDEDKKQIVSLEIQKLAIEIKQIGTDIKICKNILKRSLKAKEVVFEISNPKEVSKEKRKEKYVR